MQTEKNAATSFNLFQFSLKQGLYLGLMLVIFTIIQYAGGLYRYPSFAYLAFVILIGALVWSYQLFKKENGGYMTYSQGLTSGTLLSVTGGLIASVFNIIYTNFIDPGIMKAIQNQARRTYEEMGRFSDQEIEMMMGFVERFMHPAIILLIGIFSYVLVGFICSLIVAAFMKKSNPNPM